jgi:hypothetical protein
MTSPGQAIVPLLYESSPPRALAHRVTKYDDVSDEQRPTYAEGVITTYEVQASDLGTAIAVAARRAHNDGYPRASVVSSIQTGTKLVDDHDVRFDVTGDPQTSAAAGALKPATADGSLCV